MKAIDSQIMDINRTISGNIAALAEQDRGLLSQNILSQLRNFVEHISLKAMAGNNDINDSYENIQKANAYVKTRGELSFLKKFHKLVQITASHYTLDQENSERLMLKYYEYLLRIKDYLEEKHGLTVLENIDSFPINLDPAFTEYHEKIAERIQSLDIDDKFRGDRYYVHSSKPFFVKHKVYYEVTFHYANDKASKFDRVIAFSSLDIPASYALRLSLVDDEIDIMGKKMPIKLIDQWEVWIRPCEINNFAKIFDLHLGVQSSYTEYKNLMLFLTKSRISLAEVMWSSDEYYLALKQRVTERVKTVRIFNALDKARDIVRKQAPGSNILSYLLFCMNNRIIKDQYVFENCDRLSGLCLKYGCVPFDDMPFNSSLINHNPRVSDVLECIDPSNREHEFLARRINHNVEYKGELYTPVDTLGNFNEIDKLISVYNQTIYRKHGHRKIEKHNSHLYIKGYEDDTLKIINNLKELSSEGLDGYANSVETWLKTSSYNIDSPEKKTAIETLFKDSKVALIYGAAGTGKSTMINHISAYLADKSKLYLANTNPAVDNLKRKVVAANSTFKTIAKHLSYNNDEKDFDVLIIDECSTVSNADLVKVLEQTNFSLLVLVGDVYQIESILFGNWFNAVRYFIPSTSIFELTQPFRANDESLLELWNRVRNMDETVLEHITRNGYSASLDVSIFDRSGDDEIILCLNYDGLYGINNVNRFLQGSNPNAPVRWGVSTYKVGDPVLFNELERFKPVVFNNMKGKIVGIALSDTGIQFDVEIDSAVTELDIRYLELELISSENGKSVVRFIVFKGRNTDEDDDSTNTIIPFQIAYAVSIHKAQGLEYDSVKIVITDEVDEKVTHNIFYTAITRARSLLKIYWSPEVEARILSGMEHKVNRKDVVLLSNKYGLEPDFSG